MSFTSDVFDLEDEGNRCVSKLQKSAVNLSRSESCLWISAAGSPPLELPLGRAALERPTVPAPTSPVFLQQRWFTFASPVPPLAVISFSLGKQRCFSSDVLFF